MPRRQPNWRASNPRNRSKAGTWERSSRPREVVGRPFSFELLEKVTDWDESSLSHALDELWRRRIIESRGASEYDFTHDRLREVACAELSLVRRGYLPPRGARALTQGY